MEIERGTKNVERPATWCGVVVSRFAVIRGISGEGDSYKRLAEEPSSPRLDSEDDSPSSFQRWAYPPPRRMPILSLIPLLETDRLPEISYDRRGATESRRSLRAGTSDEKNCFSNDSEKSLLTGSSVGSACGVEAGFPNSRPIESSLPRSWLSPDPS